MKRKILYPALLLCLILIGGGGAFQPEWLLDILMEASPSVIYSVETDRPAVALTIDDGPDAQTTPEILSLLRKHGAKATFFPITQNILGNEALLAQMVEEGHELGNHLGSDRPSILLGANGFRQEAQQAHELLSRFGPVRWLRPGSGWYNGEMISTAESLGYQIALGSVYPFDALLPSSWIASRYILWRVKPGSIIVLHDVGARGERTAATLKEILPELDGRGYQILTLSELNDLENASP